VRTEVVRDLCWSTVQSGIYLHPPIGGGTPPIDVNTHPQTVLPHWGCDCVSGVGRILVWGGRIEAPRGRGAKGAEGGGVRGGGVPPHRGRGLGRGLSSQKICDYLILKWRILMHISGILTYLF